MPTAGGFNRPGRGAGTNPLAGLPDLFHAALDEFSAKSYEEASLNDVIRAAGISKGSFYYRFADKADLYLCMVDRIVTDKLAYFAAKQAGGDFPADFFDQLKVLASAGLEYARQEPRYYGFMRRFIAESGAIRQSVKDAFPDAGRDSLLFLVQAARANGQFREEFTDEFICAMLQLLLGNLDTLLTPQTTDDQMQGLIDKLASLLKSGIGTAN